VARALDRLGGAGLARRVVIDASHGNSAKDPVGQLKVIGDLATRIGHGETGIVGVMVESFLVAGRQELVVGRRSQLTYGQSVTDACIGWEDTVGALAQLASAVAKRRGVADRELSAV
jgi:3-deoxy-7-phosphoheptulonate synthase